MAWGTQKTPCTDLIHRITSNDATLSEVYILPTRAFGDNDLNSLSAFLEQSNHRADLSPSSHHDGDAQQQPPQQHLQKRPYHHWKALFASGHVVSSDALHRFGRAVSSSRTHCIAKLAIGHASMGDDGIHALLSGLSDTHCPLHELDLSYKGATCRGLASVATLTAVSPLLVTLNLSRNPLLGQDETSSIGNTTQPDGNIIGKDWMNGAFRHVQHLDLSDCGFHVDACRTILAPLLDTSPSQEKTAATMVSATDMSAKPSTPLPTMTVLPLPLLMAAAAGAGAALLVLRLDHNPITDDGLYALRLADTCPVLQELHVSHCQLTGASLPHQVVLAANTSANTVTSNDSQAMSLRSAWPASCRVLDLSHNELTAVGMRQWHDAIVLQPSSSLLASSMSFLNVSNNGTLKEEGVLALLDVLTKRGSLMPFSDNASPSTSIDNSTTGKSGLLLDLSNTRCGAVAASRALQVAIADPTCRIHTLRLSSVGQTPVDGTDLVQVLATALRESYNALGEIVQACPPHSQQRRTLSSPLCTLDVSGNQASVASVVSLLQAVLDVAKQVVAATTSQLQTLDLIDCLIIGGNEGGEAVEALVQDILAVHPTMDIARDKIKRTNASSEGGSSSALSNIL